MNDEVVKEILQEHKESKKFLLSLNLAGLSARYLSDLEYNYYKRNNKKLFILNKDLPYWIELLEKPKSVWYLAKHNDIKTVVKWLRQYRLPEPNEEYDRRDYVKYANRYWIPIDKNI